MIETVSYPLQQLVAPGSGCWKWQTSRVRDALRCLVEQHHTVVAPSNGMVHERIPPLFFKILRQQRLDAKQALDCG